MPTKKKVVQQTGPKTRQKRTTEGLSLGNADHDIDADTGVGHDTMLEENPEPIWKPADNLWRPDPPEGVEYRWVRYATRSGMDMKNFKKSAQEGWQPVRAADVAESARHSLASEQIDGVGEVFATGDLVLCQRDSRMGKQRAAHYNGRLAEQNQAIQGTNLKSTMRGLGQGKMDAVVGSTIKTRQGRVPKVAD